MSQQAKKRWERGSTRRTEIYLGEDFEVSGFKSDLVSGLHLASIGRSRRTLACGAVWALAQSAMVCCCKLVAGYRVTNTVA